MGTLVKVRVPGTTANCGPGFDSIGMACTIYNELELTLSGRERLSIEVCGEGAGMIPCDEHNIALQAIQAVLTRVGTKERGIVLRMENTIPLARGLGSSAAAIVAGLVAANVATGNQLSREEIFNMATQIEGHPDNVAPALYGGITLSVVEGKNAHCLNFTPPAELKLVVAIPAFGLSTQVARQVLPDAVSLEDAVFNISRAALLIGALTQGKLDFLQYALPDRIHQPYREKLIPGMAAVFQSAIQAGALGAAISGAGPCLVAFTRQNCDTIGEAMVAAFEKHEVVSRYIVMDIDLRGAVVI
ncbi:homoserine kinase signature [Lucifera butyrica]|uniref:Homoserine kinase n=1 Tax=Lucifera butyrica TaxID=1351585 RepID=A0A498R5P6_9FIRM|nr:homoserine kinase [Lucifera butyrica]VBB06157.1 homoserine kinase signature [Lucifera butyrica]